MKLKKVLPLALSAALMLSFSACNKNGQISGGDDDLSKVVAIVGEENISALELKFYLSMDKGQVETEAGVADKTDEEKKKYWKEEGAEKKQEIIDKTLENLKELKLFIADAKKENIKLEQTDLDGITQSIDQIIQSEGNGDKAETDKVMMKDYGVNVDQYQIMFTDYVLAYNKYAQVKPTQIEISDSEVQGEFDKNKEKYNKVTVKHVLISTVDQATNEKLPEDKVAEKKTLAEEILKKAQAGEDFEALASEYSEDPGSKDSGGEYTFGKGEMVAEFEDWSFSAKEGDLGIVESSFGFHVMKFIKFVGDDEIKASITASLQNEKFTKMVEEMKAGTQLVKNQEVIDSLELF